MYCEKKGEHEEQMKQGRLTMKKRQKPAWLQRLPVHPSQLTFDELRNFQEADRSLTEPIEGSEVRRYFLGCFRFLMAYALVTIAENRFPPLTRCWNELENMFMHDEMFDDGLFVPTWILCDFPCGPHGQTLLEVFDAEFLHEPEKTSFSEFVEQMRISRLGVYQEILGSQTTIRFVELITGDTVNTVRTVQHYEPGEVFLTRLVRYKGDLYHFGDSRCWPKSDKAQVEDFVRERLKTFTGRTVAEQYDTFMRLAGHYWMSVTSQTDIPLLPPDYYLRYFRET